MGEYISIDVVVLYILGLVGRPTSGIRQSIGKEDLRPLAFGVSVVAFGLAFVLATMGLQHRLPTVNLDDSFSAVLLVLAFSIAQGAVALAICRVLRLPIDLNRLLLCSSIYFYPWLPLAFAAPAFFHIGIGLPVGLSLFLVAAVVYGLRLADEPKGICKTRCQCASILSCVAAGALFVCVLAIGTKPAGPNHSGRTAESATVTADGRG